MTQKPLEQGARRVTNFLASATLSIGPSQDSCAVLFHSKEIKTWWHDSLARRGEQTILYYFNRIKPNPIALRSFSGYLLRAFSASCLDLKGFDKGVNSP